MIIDNPSPRHISALRSLWKQAFGDSDRFLDLFFENGFAFDRCRCVFQEGEPVAAVYLFDGTWNGEKVAYLYALAVEKDHQKQGLSRLLLADTHGHLQQSGYVGCIMEPATESLQEYYGRLGYRLFGGRDEKKYCKSENPSRITELGTLAYENQRKALLPVDGICQAGAMTEFLQSQAILYGGPDFVAAVSREERRILEFLGDTKQIPALLCALKWDCATVRTPGSHPKTVYLDFAGRENLPSYFGLPMD